MKDALAKQEERKQRCEDKAREAEERFDQSNRDHEEAQAKVSELYTLRAPLNEKQREAKEAFDSNKNSLFANQQEQRSIKSLRDSAKNEVARKKDEIQEEYQKLEAANGGSEATKLAEIKDAENTARESKRQYDEHQESYEQLARTRNDAEAREKALKPTISAAASEVNKAEDRLAGLRQRGDQQMSAFNSALPSLLKAIERDNRYHRKPVGPIGLHVRLKKPEWSSIMEKTLGGNLNAFVVTSKHDQNILSETMRRVHW